MANANRPTGLSPVKYLNGAPWSGQANVYSIATDYAVALYIGDPVISSGTADVNGVPGVALAAATGAIRGVIVGLGSTYEECIGNINNPNITYRPAATQTTTWYAMVVDDPNVVFAVQEIGTGTYLTATEVGLNANLSLAAGNGYVSGWMLDNSGEGTTSTIQVRLLGLVRTIDNAFGQYAKWLVKINNHELAAGTSGV